MSKLTEAYRTIGIHNEYEFAGHGNVAIHYQPYDKISGVGSWWMVYRPGYKTDPGGHWISGDNKTFTVWSRKEKGATLTQAKEWASAKYGIKEWAKTPFGGWMDAEYVKRRKAELAAQLKEKEKAA